jgi:hypothetical protein
MRLTVGRASAITAYWKDDINCLTVSGCVWCKVTDYTTIHLLQVTVPNVIFFQKIRSRVSGQSSCLGTYRRLESTRISVELTDVERHSHTTYRSTKVLHLYPTT